MKGRTSGSNGGIKELSIDIRTTQFAKRSESKGEAVVVVVKIKCKKVQGMDGDYREVSSAL